MKLKILVRALLCHYLILIIPKINYAQALNIGDTIPERLWHTAMRVVNQPEGKDTIRLIDYKKQLLILDFWASWCGSCIKSFPKIDSLSQQYKGTVKILLINSKSKSDNAEKANRLLVSKSNKVNLYSVVEDTLLKQLFPHESLPHYVWIKDNKVIAKSLTEDITTININKVLAGEEITTAYVPKIDYDYLKPLFENGNGGTPSRYLQKSILAPYVNGLKGSIYTQKNDQGLINKVTFINMPLLSIYKYAYPELTGYSGTRVLPEIKNKAAFIANHDVLSWRQNHLYNYELELPPAAIETIREVIKNDLSRYFGYKVFVEERELPCWIIKTSNKQKLVASDKPKAHTLNSLFKGIENRFKEVFVDETGLSPDIKIDYYPTSLISFSEMQKELLANGFELKKGIRNIAVIVITNK